MAPVIQRIADQLWKRFSPCLEFLSVGSVAGDVLFIDAVGTHLTPLVMVASKPYLGDVLELAVLADLLGIDMAVIVQNRHRLSIVMVKFLCHLCG